MVALTPEESKYGAVETHEEAKRCAELFRSKATAIDGVIVTLPNFGDERAIADTLRLARLQRARADAGDAGHARQDDHHAPARQLLRQNVGLQQPQAIRHSRTRSPRCTRKRPILRNSPRISNGSPAVCRVVNGLRNLRIGAIGARPTAFNTVRYSEKLLEASGISVETIDLSEILGRISRMKDR